MQLQLNKWRHARTYIYIICFARLFKVRFSIAVRCCSVHLCRTAPHRMVLRLTKPYRNAPHRKTKFCTAPRRRITINKSPHRTAPHRTVEYGRNPTARIGFIRRKNTAHRIDERCGPYAIWRFIWRLGCRSAEIVQAAHKFGMRSVITLVYSCTYTKQTIITRTESF